MSRLVGRLDDKRGREQENEEAESHLTHSMKVTGGESRKGFQKSGP